MIKARDTTMLVDAGLSARQLSRRLEQVGVDPDSLDGILLTHEHRDHTCGLEVFLRKRSTPVFTTALTRESLGDRITGSVDWRIFQHGQVFKVGEVTVEAFALPHDAVDPVGFVCRAGDAGIGVATDFGFVLALYLLQAVEDQSRSAAATAARRLVQDVFSFASSGGLSLNSRAARRDSGPKRQLQACE